MLGLMRIRMTHEDRNWKGHLGRLGEEIIVFRRPMPSPTVEGTHRRWGNGVCYYQSENFEQIPFGIKGIVMALKEAPEAYRSWRMRRAVKLSLADFHRNRKGR
ncbi:hypothetical protein [Methylobacterium bullatum]|uniref:Uncharacterized protein n=1 Tax=Methylobacterium bullatum TaxID=570505 RepID=A0AAV4ZBX7_9HYPH|nr:hypothetical protein [Methylobacterium bullatum]MBD8902816.1 hypothetical protein [Methylobacterium bullatum]GJD41273.1 hypothetical protein OICFNHDK_3756 [Methylobacterium bullatum]